MIGHNEVLLNVFSNDLSCCMPHNIVFKQFNWAHYNVVRYVYLHDLHDEVEFIELEVLTIDV